MITDLEHETIFDIEKNLSANAVFFDEDMQHVTVLDSTQAIPHLAPEGSLGIVEYANVV